MQFFEQIQKIINLLAENNKILALSGKDVHTESQIQALAYLAADSPYRQRNAMKVRLGRE